MSLDHMFDFIDDTFDATITDIHAKLDIADATKPNNNNTPTTNTNNKNTSNSVIADATKPNNNNTPTTNTQEKKLAIADAKAKLAIVNARAKLAIRDAIADAIADGSPSRMPLLTNSEATKKNRSPSKKRERNDYIPPMVEDETFEITKDVQDAMDKFKDMDWDSGFCMKNVFFQNIKLDDKFGFLKHCWKAHESMREKHAFDDVNQFAENILFAHNVWMQLPELNGVEMFADLENKLGGNFSNTSKKVKKDFSTITSFASLKAMCHILTNSYTVKKHVDQNMRLFMEQFQKMISEKLNISATGGLCATIMASINNKTSLTNPAPRKKRCGGSDGSGGSDDGSFGGMDRATTLVMQAMQSRIEDMSHELRKMSENFRGNFTQLFHHLNVNSSAVQQLCMHVQEERKDDDVEII